MIPGRPVPVFGTSPGPGTTPRHPVIVVNPRSRRASAAVAEVVRQCERLGVPTPTSLATTRLNPGRSQARDAIDAGADLVIVVGGDGTIREVAHQLAGTEVRLGIVALGSGNVLAYNLGLGMLGLAAQVGVALTGAIARLDVGWAKCRTVDGDLDPEPFLTMVGIGRDAETVARTSLHDKRRFGWVAYAAAGVREALHRPVPMRIQTDDEAVRDVLTWTVLVGSTPAAPGGVLIHPGGLADDGVLDVLEVPIRHPGQWIGIGIKGLTHHSFPVAALRRRRGRRIRVWPVGPRPVQLDGDVIDDVTDLQVWVESRSLLVQVPGDTEENE